MAKEEKDPMNTTENKVNTDPSNAGNQENKEEIMAESQANGQEEVLPDEKELLKNEVAELKDKYLRLYSEFENFRRRTAKERIDLVKTANEDVLASLLPILDDFERGIKSMNEAKEVSALKEGINLIYNKLFRTLEAKGLKPMNAVGNEFNSELHEAITQIPAPSEEMKGKVVDEVEKGYYLNEKVIRFAKVVIGS